MLQTTCDGKSGVLYRSLAVLIALCGLCVLPAYSQPSVLYIGHVNGDAYADTLIGRALGGAPTLLPDKIVWGRDHINPQPPTGPPATAFIYPAWQRFAGSVSFVHLNTNDTLTDLLFFLWGYNDSAAVEPDTGRALAVFGQAALSSQPVIDLAQIASGFQSQPFFAQDMQVNIHLTQPKVRDLTDVESYLLAPVNLPVQGPPPVVTQVSDSAEVRIYPNPSLYSATIEAELPAGHYTATVIGISGQVVGEQSIVVEQAGTLWRTIDVSALVSGYYVVQLRRDGTIVGTYPFLIRR